MFSWFPKSRAQSSSTIHSKSNILHSPIREYSDVCEQPSQYHHGIVYISSTHKLNNSSWKWWGIDIGSIEKPTITVEFSERIRIYDLHASAIFTSSIVPLAYDFPSEIVIHEKDLHEHPNIQNLPNHGTFHDSYQWIVSPIGYNSHSKTAKEIHFNNHPDCFIDYFKNHPMSTPRILHNPFNGAYVSISEGSNTLPTPVFVIKCVDHTSYTLKLLFVYDYMELDESKILSMLREILNPFIG